MTPIWNTSTVTTMIPSHRAWPHSSPATRMIAGHIASFVMGGELEVTYWVDRALWGKGVATAALARLLDIVAERPIHGRAAKDNLGSVRVLEKCGFERVGEERGFANARGEEIDEVVYRRDD
jgi:RimJ/RimL family protein N-acetyltransferase